MGAHAEDSPGKSVATGTAETRRACHHTVHAIDIDGVYVSIYAGNERDMLAVARALRPFD